jgi:hypothetical protein
MKKLIVLTVFLAIAAQPGFADIFFQPQFSTINVGDALNVDVKYSGAVSPWLGGYDIDVTYDPTVLSLFGVWWGDNFLAGSIRDATFTPGVVNVAEVSLSGLDDLGNAQSGHDPFRLFTLMFNPALAPGISVLSFQRVDLTDGDGHLLGPGQTPAGSVTVNGVSGVPEPSAVLLFLIPAFSSLAILRKRLRQN